jgi:ABC-type dipeptide/oligopeptide/nickel transport system ATPase component
MLNVPVPTAGAARRRIILRGNVASPINLPSAWRFHARCPHVFDRCPSDEPARGDANGADTARGLAVP